MLQILNHHELDITSLLDTELLEKAIKHAYFSHLVPVRKRGVDGVTRTYWVNPDPKKLKKTKSKKSKLQVVSAHNDGTHDEHRAEILKDHEIDFDKDVTSLHHGDVVKLTKDKAGLKPGTEGIFDGLYVRGVNKTPTISVKVKNAKGDYVSKQVNVNAVELVKRGNSDTRDKITKPAAASRVPATSAETNQQRHERLGKEVVPGGIYIRNSDGQQIFTSAIVGDKIKVTVLSAKGKGKEGYVETSKIQGLLNACKYTRMIKPKTALYESSMAPVKDASGNTVTDPATGKPKMVIQKRLTPNLASRMLESGEFHRQGVVKYDSAGKGNVDQDSARKIIVEQWPTIDAAVGTAVSKYDGVDQSDIDVSDIIRAATNAINTFEPYMNNDVQPWIRQYVYDKANKKAQSLHDMRRLKTALAPVDGDGASPVSRIPTNSSGEPISDIASGGFNTALDSIILGEGIEEEADFLAWHIDNPEVAAVVGDWLGLGAREQTYNRKEAAAALVGIMKNPATGEAYSQSSIERMLTEIKTKLVGELRNEFHKYPEFQRDLGRNLRLRNKIANKREVSADVPIKVRSILDKHDGGRKSKAEIAAKLIHAGVPMSEAPDLVDITERIIRGDISPMDYHKIIPERHQERVQMALDRILNIKGPEARGKLPERFRIYEAVKRGKRIAAASEPAGVLN